MRNSFVILYLYFSLSVSGATYYVATTGSNSNSGTKGLPWLTLQYAFGKLVAGDTLYIRGGTYTGMHNTNYGVSINNRDGTAIDPINVYAYPGETPILDCSGLSGANTHYGIYFQYSVYWHFKGLIIQDVREYSDGAYTAKGFELSNCSHILFELMTVRGCGNGFTFGGSGVFEDIRFLNCDAYENYDYYDSGGLANGFNLNIPAGSTIEFEGCRAWLNSDDGWDAFGGDGYITINNCWAFENGNYVTRGNGSGFKIGAVTANSKEAGVQRTVTNCLAWNNTGIGIDESMDFGAYDDVTIFNNTSYNNNVNFNFVTRVVNTGNVKLTNNISYRGTYPNNIRSQIVQTTNSWQGGLNVSDTDFLSIDPTGTKGARKADGSLPDINFLHLVAGSDLIDAGVNVKIPYSGNSPDLGPFEFKAGSTTTPVPVYISSVVENANPSLLEMTYNLNLNNLKVPSTSSFNVLVNSQSRSLNSVSISGSKVRLTLLSKVKFGDIITVSYTKPATNPLQTTSGGQAATISAKSVTNNTINIAPTAAITSPINNSSFTSLANVTITANALDADGSITKVDFYNGNTKLGSKSVAPYIFTWNNVAAGTYSLMIIATDNLNAKTTSTAISISVNNVTPTLNQPPVVIISNPHKGNKFENPATIDIDVVASDPDGTISKVELFNGSNKLVELTSAPYSYTWKDVNAGTYIIKAIATDNLNATSTSSLIEFTVGDVSRYDANSEIISLYPNPNDGHFSIEFVNPLQNEKYDIIITDLAGKQVYRGPLLKEEISKKFDLSYIKSGIYMMMIIDKVILITKKFIKN